MAIQTVCDLFYRSVDTFRKPEHLKYKKDGAWRAISSDELRAAVEETSMGLRALGVEQGRPASPSSPRTGPSGRIADLATLCAGAADAPIYPTLTAAQVHYILDDSEAKVVFVSNAAQAAKVAEVAGAAPAPRSTSSASTGAAPRARLPLDELRARGREALGAGPRRACAGAPARCTPDDLATLIYTSGTTGDPKGVMLTHDNLVHNVLDAREGLPAWSTPSGRRSASCRSATASSARPATTSCSTRGVTIAYAESVEKVPENMQRGAAARS